MIIYQKKSWFWYIETCSVMLSWKCRTYHPTNHKKSGYTEPARLTVSFTVWRRTE